MHGTALEKAEAAWYMIRARETQEGMDVNAERRGAHNVMGLLMQAVIVRAVWNERHMIR